MSSRRGATVLLLAWLVTGQTAGCHRPGVQEAKIEPGRLVRQGWDAVDREDAEAAREAIRRLRATGQSDLAAVLQARLLVARGFFQPALDVAATVAGAGQPQADTELARLVRLVRGEAAYRMKIYPVAEREYLASLRIDPDSADAHRQLAAMYYDAGVIPASIRHLEETARLAPSDHRPHRLLGLIHNDYERYDDAVGFYEESLRRDPDQADRDEVLTELATCQMKLRRHRDALATLGKLGPGDAPDVLRAECHLAMGQRDQARRLVDDVLRRNPDDLGALILVGEMRLEDGDPAGAVDPLARAVVAHPRDYRARLKLAQAYAGCAREADADAERAEAERIRSVRRAFADLHQAAWDAPGDAEVRRKLAAIAAELGRPDLEKVWLEAAAAVAVTAGGTTPPTGTPDAAPAPAAER